MAQPLKRDILSHNPIPEIALLHSLADKGAAVNRFGCYVVQELLILDNKAYRDLPPLQQWAVVLGWREEEHMRRFD